MPDIEFSLHTYRKRVALAISRGVSTHSSVVWLRWSEGGVTGWGEAAPFHIDDHPQTIEVIRAALEEHLGWLSESTAWDRIGIDERLRAQKAPSAAIAAVNMALHDWLGKKVGQPVWRLLGLRSHDLPVTSVTIGIMPPAAAAARVGEWLESTDARAFKVKLGSREGPEADRAMFDAVRSAIPAGARVSVDANGGWSLATAIHMAAWLSERGIDHLEQPLPRGQESDLDALRRTMKIPLIVDESCRTGEELASLAPHVDGINIKLMKCGGLDGALQLVHTARAHGLKILVGCYGNTALANTAAAQLGALVDYFDLDSHLNLEDAPFRGGTLDAGRLRLSDQPGLGVSHV